MFVLLVTGGPSRGQSLLLRDGDNQVGRREDSDLCLRDEKVSRRQFCVSIEAGTMVVRNLSPQVSLLINGKTVTIRDLKSGDRIQVGDSVLLVDERVSRPPQDSGSCSSSISIESSVEVLSESYPAPEEIRVRSAPGPRVVEDRNILYRLSFQLAAAHTTPELHQSLVELARDGTHADRAILLRYDPEGDGWIPEAFSEKKTETSPFSATIEAEACRETPGYSSTALYEAHCTRRGILCMDAASDIRFEGTESVQRHGIRSVIVAPIVVADQVVAALYADCLSDEYRFVNDDLSLLAALANQASVTMGRLDREPAPDREPPAASESIHTVMTFVARTAPMIQLRETLEKVATRDVSILIRGAPGSGRTQSAWLVHASSSRAEGPFVAVNCLSLPEESMETVLFGACRESAGTRSAVLSGRVQQANHGTLYLGNIEHLSPGCQRRLLGLAGEGELMIPGGTWPLPVDVRIVAGAGASLREKIRRREFLEDLYHLLAVIDVEIPPLEGRGADILELARQFMNHFARKHGKPVERMHPRAEDLLAAHHWTGCALELRGVIERAVVLCDGTEIASEDLGLAQPPDP